MHRGYLKALEKLGVQNGGRLIDKTIIVDFLMANFDRHTHNFGLIRDAEELDRYRIAPLFDHGCGFYSRATTTELEQGCYLWESPPSGNTPRSGLPSSRTSAGTTPRPLGTSKTSLQRFMAKTPRRTSAL